MIQTICFFIVAYFAGLAIIKLLKLDLGRITYPASMVIGVVFLCLLFFFLGFAFGSLKLLGVLMTLIMIGVGSGVVLRREIRKIRGIRGIWRLKGVKGEFLGMITAGFFVILVIWLFGRALFFNSSGSLVAGDRLVWTDWPLHIGMASNFAYGANFPPQNPHFAGIFLNYPFMADFLSGILLSLGAGLPISFAVPGIVLILCFFWLFVIFTGGIVGDMENKGDRVGFLALFLSLFWGGLGWLYWLKEAFGSEVEFVSTILSPAREYTFWSEKNLWFFTFLYSEILPQRAFIFGLPMFFLVLMLLKKGWDKPSFAKATAGKGGDNKEAKKYLFFAGVLGGIMPFFHTHSFIALWILTLSWSLLSLFVPVLRKPLVFPWKKRFSGTGYSPQQGVFLVTRACLWGSILKKAFWQWFWFFLPLGVLSLIQAPLFLQQGAKVQFLWGWMKGSENFFIFWFKNTGLFWPLLLWGLIKIKLPGFAKALFLSSIALFVIPNLFQFAPWGYDNLKIFTFWYLLGSVVVAWVLIKIGEIGVIGKIGKIIIILTLTLSGLVEVGRLVNTKAINIGLWSKEDQETAQMIREKTPPDAVFLTAAIHDHPVEALAGRKIVLGYPGNSWSWGIAGWDTREKDIHAMFQGTGDVLGLLKKYRINYIVVSDRERWFEPKLDENFIAKNGELVLETGKTRVYRVK